MSAYQRYQYSAARITTIAAEAIKEIRGRLGFLKNVGLEYLTLDRAAPTLSGGEMQRGAIARALVNRPEILIADEPTAHLDSKLSREFMEIIGSLQARGKTVLIASHDPIVFDSPLADTVIEMRDGGITGIGSPS